MPTPRLQNPIMVRLRQTDDSKTVFSDRRREPVGLVNRGIVFNIPAQIFFGQQEFVGDAAPAPAGGSRNLAGDILATAGYIVVLKADLKRLGKTLKLNDEIIGYGRTGTESTIKVFLVKTKDAAHYSDQGHTLEVWYFQERA